MGFSFGNFERDDRGCREDLTIARGWTLNAVAAFDSKKSELKERLIMKDTNPMIINIDSGAIVVLLDPKSDGSPLRNSFKR